MSTFRSAFKERSINIRLITTEKETEPIVLRDIESGKNEIEAGIVYVSNSILINWSSIGHFAGIQLTTLFSLQIPYAPHPSAAMVLILLNRVQPKNVIKIGEKPFHGFCSDILDRVYAEPFLVEDGDAEECDEAALSDFYNMNEGETEDEPTRQRSFLSDSNISDDFDSIDGHESNENVHIGTPPIVERTADATHHENDQNTNGIDIADAPMHNANCNAIVAIQPAPKVAGTKATNVSGQIANTAKRKSTTIDLSESDAKVFRRNRTKRIQYLSSSNSSNDIAPTHNNNCSDINDNTSIISMNSSEIDPFMWE